MIRSTLTVLGLLGLLAGCTYDRSYEEAKRMLAEGDALEGLAKLEQAVKDNPRNTTYRAALLRERERVASGFVLQGDSALKAGNFDLAVAHYKEARRIDPSGFRANAGLQEVEKARRHAARIAEAEALIAKKDYSGAEGVLRGVLAENPYQSRARELLRNVIESVVATEPPPILKTPYKKPITLEFRDAQLKTVFELLSRTSGINFVFDRDVKTDQKITVFVRNTTLDDVLRLILTTNQLDRKVLNENSVLIYPATPAKQKDYRELVVRSFYLASADVKQASAMIKTLMKTQDVFIDEKLNLLVIKDTPEVVRLADQLIRSLDLSEPEVMLEVEVLEVARTRLQELGIKYPGSVSLQAPLAGINGAATTIPVDSPLVFTTANPMLVFNLRATVGTTNILANPRIRVKNKEKARIHVGDKVPVFTSTAAANVGVSTSVSYLDVGLKLDVEPQIYLQDEVGIKIGMEVSNIVETITVATGTGSTVAYRLGTRNANTVLQLKDGETQILAGLISDEDRRSSQRVPGLGDIPGLAHLFGSSLDNRTKTEIVLMITPRIVRNLIRPEGVAAEMAVGTDTFPGMPSLRIAKTAPGTMAMAPGGGNVIAGSVPPQPPRDVSPPQAVILMAPERAQVDREFSVEVVVPSSNSGSSGRIDIQYDPKLLQLMDPAANFAGSASLTFAADVLSRGVRFKVLPGAAGVATISVTDVALVDRDGFALGATAPPPITVKLFN
jgi:general secretion pathway protein D